MAGSREDLTRNYNSFIVEMKAYSYLANVPFDEQGSNFFIPDSLLEALLIEEFGDDPDDIVRYFQQKLTQGKAFDFLANRIIALFFDRIECPEFKNKLTIESEIDFRHARIWEITKRLAITWTHVKIKNAQLSSNVASDIKCLSVLVLQSPASSCNGLIPITEEDRQLACHILGCLAVNYPVHLSECVTVLYDFASDWNSPLCSTSTRSLFNIMFSGSDLHSCHTLSRCLTKQLEMIDSAVNDRNLITRDREHELLGYHKRQSIASDDVCILDRDAFAEGLGRFNDSLVVASSTINKIINPSESDEIVSALIKRIFGNHPDQVVSFFCDQLSKQFAPVYARIIKLFVSDAPESVKQKMSDMISEMLSKSEKSDFETRLSLYAVMARLPELLPVNMKEEIMNYTLECFRSTSQSHARNKKRYALACDVLVSMAISVPEYRNQCIDILVGSMTNSYKGMVSENILNGLLRISSQLSKLEFCNLMSRCLSVGIGYLSQEVRYCPSPTRRHPDMRIRLFGYEKSSEGEAPLSQPTSTQSP